MPPGVSQAIARALAKEPDKRFTMAADFRDAIAVTAPPSVQRHTLTRSWLVAALTVAAIAGIGGSWAIRHREGPPFIRAATIVGGTNTIPVRLAVLPFDNIGDSADAYFADGLTDAVRGKLAQISGLEVIASASSDQYRHTRKSPSEIGRELGVRYLLGAKIRWIKNAGQPGRIQIQPELVEAAKAADRWGQPFDVPDTDVFHVQASIAENVVRALQVTLTPSAKSVLVDRPTKSPDAYDAYLRGLGVQQTGLFDYYRSAIPYYQEAVRRDSSFALAWAALAAAYAGIADPDYAGNPPILGDAEAARAALGRAQRLAPTLTEVWRAEAEYDKAILHQPRRALAVLDSALLLTRDDPGLLVDAASIETDLGDFEAASTLYQRAVPFDPQDRLPLSHLGWNFVWLRRYSDARAAYDLARGIAPGDANLLAQTAMAAIAAGDLETARAVSRAVPPGVDTTTYLAYILGVLRSVLASGSGSD